RRCPGRRRRSGRGEDCRVGSGLPPRGRGAHLGLARRAGARERVGVPRLRLLVRRGSLVGRTRAAAWFPERPTWRKIVRWVRAPTCTSWRTARSSTSTHRIAVLGMRSWPWAFGPQTVSGGYGEEGRRHRDRG